MQSGKEGARLCSGNVSVAQIATHTNTFTWRLITLNAMKASDEISEEQSRQVSNYHWYLVPRITFQLPKLLFDIDHAYHEFFSSLGGGSKAP